MKLLYHGSTMEITEIDLSRSKPNKDFGKGFYLSEDRQQAFEMASYKTIQLDMEHNIDLPTFLERLKYMRGITFQYFFGTERAIKLLRKL